MNGKNSRFTDTPLGFCDILGPFAKGSKRNIVKVAILLAGKAAGTPGGDVLFFLVNEPSLF